MGSKKDAVSPSGQVVGANAAMHSSQRANDDDRALPSKGQSGSHSAKGIQQNPYQLTCFNALQFLLTPHLDD